MAGEHIIIMIRVNVAVLKRDAPVPLYHQLKAALLGDIESGRWRPGERLPTEDELIDRFKVSKITVRHALRDLTQLGYIRREQGRGTFVQGPPLEEGPRELKSFTSEVQGHGFRATSRVLEQGVVTATPDIAARLEVPEGEAVFRLHRLRLADGEPMGLQTAYIPMRLVPGIDKLSFTGASLYEVLASRYSLYPAGARETHQAVQVTEEAALLLRAPVGSPALAAERLTSLEDGRPLELVHSIMRGDRYKIVLDLRARR
ncbi:MAG TPA: GntR family transcriptional regulator [Vicinamibacterales bacterium]|nr:GntR family transcriptional regulator [Vicinamibacterales bacterium]